MKINTCSVTRAFVLSILGQGLGEYFRIDDSSSVYTPITQLYSPKLPTLQYSTCIKPNRNFSSQHLLDFASIIIHIKDQEKREDIRDDKMIFKQKLSYRIHVEFEFR